MPDGISIHIGVNRVDPAHYQSYSDVEQPGWAGDLEACERDALALAEIARAEGFEACTVLADRATSAEVAGAIVKAAASLGSGDIFMATFSGYGGMVADRNSDERRQEPTWALFDRQFPEDEVTALIGSLASGVRALVLDDSSSFGTVRRGFATFTRATAVDGDIRTRALPADIVDATYRNHQIAYDAIQDECPTTARAVPRASLLTIRGFRENQSGEETAAGGVFTSALVATWNRGAFQGSYREFVAKIAGRMPPTQSPAWTKGGAGKPFLHERPFTI